MTLNRAAQIEALTQAMSSMPGMDPTRGRTAVSAPARRIWATELIDKFGVSIDPNQATAEAFATNPPVMGHHGPQEVRDRENAPEVINYLRQQGPSFLAENLPDLAARVNAVTTPQQRDALIAELRDKILADPARLLNGVVDIAEHE